jgi:hypothetical protein
MLNTPIGIVGDLSKCEFSDIDVEDFKYIKGVVKHLGNAERYSCKKSKVVLTTYVNAIFDVLADLLSQAQQKSLNYETWFVCFAVNRGILLVNDGNYVWADLDFERRTYLDLFTRYFMCWNDQYRKSA